ncbi:MAG: pyridoxamine 5'-phosphate oxidase family protein [Chloracidobacterium sp.]|nr:pyridoxamine 5'-phosphate oxidase family protein [Chloracidobacterium sp.]
MIEVKVMTAAEIEALLCRTNYGHLGCAADNHPYVLPIHFGYDDGTIYIYTTEGMKSAMIDANREVCLQVEDVVDNENWTSVIIVGDAIKLTSAEDREKADAAITAVNPMHTPALSYKWVDRWVRELKDDVVQYRIDRTSSSGRSAGSV